MNSKTSGYLISCTIIAALGGFLFGFDTAVINGTIDSFANEYGIAGDGWQAFWKGFTVASALIGTIIGAYFVGKPADTYGRRGVLFVVAVLYFVSAVGSMFPPDWLGLVIFRFIGGLGVGAASVVAPMYIAEISPAKYRGRLVAVTQFNIVFGILVAFFSNMVVASLNLDIYWEWRTMFGVEAIPAFAFFWLLFLTPESPRWLIAKGKSEDAAAIFKRLGSDTENVQEEIKVIKESLAQEKDSANAQFYSKANLKIILLAFAFASFNQLSGINVIMYYATTIFQMAGTADTPELAKQSALVQGVIVGFTNLIVTIIAMSIIDHFGRKKLMIVGSIGYILSLASIAMCFYLGQSFDSEGNSVFSPVCSWLILISIMVFIASHAFGQGAVIWVFISEIFPNRIRSQGLAFGCFVHWFWNVVISWTFPIVAAKSGGNAFAFFAVMMVCQLIWVLTKMPETKGVPLEEIQKKLGME